MEKDVDGCGGCRAEMSVQFYLPLYFLSKLSFFRSFVEPQAIFCREERKPCCLMTKNEREIDVVFTTTTTAPLYGFIETLITMSGVEISVE